MKIPKSVTPRDHLKPSKLNQLMGDDLDINMLKLQIRTKIGIDISDRITEASLDRTIEGASTVSVRIDDSDRELLLSGRLTAKPDIELDGLFFRLSAASKTGDELELTFEDREIAVLRTYTKKLVVPRSQMTRAQFILGMIREVEEFNIPWVIPELMEQQPIESQVAVPYPPAFSGVGKGTDVTAGGGGVAADTGLRLGTSKLDASQIKIINTILSVGMSLQLPRKLLVISIMVAADESTFINHPMALPGTFNAGHIGVFQQDPRYWAASGDVATDTLSFLTSKLPNSKWPNGAAGLIYNYKNNPNMPNAPLAELTQGSGFTGGSNYAHYSEFAERVVTDFGIPGIAGGTPAANAMQTNEQASLQPFHFYRGTPKTVQSKTVFAPEDSWSCIKRLADEVGWRAFFVSGTFYYVSEDWLFGGPPVAIISESSDGVDRIDFEYNTNSKAASVTIDARIGRWEGVPGSVIQLMNMGPCTGRWITSNIHRSFFDQLATITLKKPRPKLPEPLTDQLPNYTNPNQSTIPPFEPSGCGATIVQAAKSQLGIAYAWGKEEAGVHFDCSGLTEWAASKAGLNIPRVAQDQWDAGPRVFGPLHPGDLVFFSESHSSSAVSHCGIFVGDGKFIHAPHTGDVIKVSDLKSGYYNMSVPLSAGGVYVGATRPCTGAPAIKKPPVSKKKCPVPNCNGSLSVQTHGTQTPVRVILHDTDGSTNAANVVAGWVNDGRGYGSQYIIEPDGITYRCANDTDICYHTGGANTGSIGIEQACPKDGDQSADWWNSHPAILEACAILLAFFHCEYNIPLIVSTDNGISTHAMQSAIHEASGGHSDPGPYYPIGAVIGRAQEIYDYNQQHPW